MAELLAQHADKRDPNGRRVVVRNGHLPARELITGIGRMPIKQPRIDDRPLAARKEPRFTSAILPRYLKRVPSVDSLIPALYLKGVSSGDFSQALEAILGKQAAGLSANSVVRLKAVWEQEYQQWTRRDLSGKRYVYFWADGLHVNVRLDQERSCILVIMGADEHGNKELVAVSDGYRESTAAWREILLDLRRRGLSVAPRLATADGALGFWAALREVYPGTEEQTCWFHKAGNVLDKMPKSVQGRAKTMLREMWQAPSLTEATSAPDQFCTAWESQPLRQRQMRMMRSPVHSPSTTFDNILERASTKGNPDCPKARTERSVGQACHRRRNGYGKPDQRFAVRHPRYEPDG